MGLSAGERPGIEASVSDTGCGISAELREQIFNPFFTTKQAGIGLGLSIVSKIIDEHHGSMELGTGAGGARVVLFFPVAQSETAPSELFTSTRVQEQQPAAAERSVLR